MRSRPGGTKKPEKVPWNGPERSVSYGAFSGYFALVRNGCLDLTLFMCGSADPSHHPTQEGTGMNKGDQR